MCSEIAVITCPTLLSQLYDGDSVMSGKKGSCKYISDTFERDIPYVHCFNHQLHLIVVDVCESITEIKYLFTQLNIINKFFKKLAVHTYFKDTFLGGHLSICIPIRWIENYKTLSDIIKYEK